MNFTVKGFVKRKTILRTIFHSVLKSRARVGEKLLTRRNNGNFLAATGFKIDISGSSFFNFEVFWNLT